MKIAVAGGTGVAGRATVEALRALGHEPVVLARSAGIDLVSGTGLAEGLVGTDAVIDTTNISTMSARAAMRFFEATARNLTRAAERAGVGHIVALSIIGIDRVPYSYYKGKIRQEGVLRDSVVAVSRMALDVLRSARVRRERYVGPWLPEPVLTGPWGAGAAIDPADKVTLDDEVSYALLVVLEALSPSERTAFVLHDLFGMAFGEVATIVGRSPVSVRQLASRARRHIREHAPSPSVDAAGHRRVVEAFEVAANSGDLATLIRLLDPDVVLVSDGGGVVTSARKPVTGADRVARFVLGVIAKAHDEGRLERVDVNGAPGFAAYYRGDLVGIVAVTVARERVTRVDIVRAPGKLPRGWNGTKT
jgi:RNA polymerase sigma-70 factor (ECF subfamily)